MNRRNVFIAMSASTVLSVFLQMQRMHLGSQNLMKSLFLLLRSLDMESHLMAQRADLPPSTEASF